MNETRKNRLSGEDSPYLLQHAHNPVDWYPWGDEAFAEARRRQVPLFVSVGYGSCYWCHVMERESFDNESTAQVMNERFVCVKVDREQRPDVDAMCMSACQVYTAATEGRASGGWPLSVFLEPEHLHPFFAGTYFPPNPNFGRPSFTQLCVGLSTAWQEKRAQVHTQALRLSKAVQAESASTMTPTDIDAALLRSAGEALMRGADQSNGGFGTAPKFPHPCSLEFLAHWQPEGATRSFIDFTLCQMSLGGIADQLGGGFHRYSVDATWTVPHFEKMLYDNAQLLALYAEAAMRTNRPLFRGVCERIVFSMQRESLRDDGLFDGSMDAEVNGREGLSFLWTPQEAAAVLTGAGLSATEISHALHALGLNAHANFKDPHHPDAPSGWVLTMADEACAVDPLIERSRALLLAVRDLRTQPRRDNKAILGWNGLAIDGLATAGRMLNEPTWIALAARTADVAFATFRQSNGAWSRVKRDGVGFAASLEDLACMIRGFQALFLATHDSVWLHRAMLTWKDAHATFFEESSSVWYETAAGRSDLFVRISETHDGAVPSGRGEILAQMAWLASCDDTGKVLEVFKRSLRAASGSIAASPSSACRSLTAVLTAHAI
ncbi:MAG: thioredoxin domain-containing protein [Planctomycetota bacterium]|nr:thioredoxin domain-containing protein [Planctomycetota bacterium]